MAGLNVQTIQHGDDLIDCHVLAYPGSDREGLDRCIASLAAQPVNVFLVENEGSIWDGRKIGYAQGACPFVTYCDADDFVDSLEGLVAAVARLQPKALFTNSFTHGGITCAPGTSYRRDRERMGGPTPFQLTVYERGYLDTIHRRIEQRSALQGRLAWTSDLATLCEVTLEDGWIYFDEPVYHWHPSRGGGRARAGNDTRYVSDYYGSLQQR